MNPERTHAFQDPVQWIALALTVQGFTSYPALAQKAPVALASKSRGVEVETEFYSGRRGYLHGGHLLGSRGDNDLLMTGAGPSF